MFAKEWRRRSLAPPGLAASLGLPQFQAQLLYNRGIEQREQADAFLATDSREFHDPLLLPDMSKAVARLTKAVEDREIIGVFGDFDTDGLAGTALLLKALRDLGATVVPYLPDRDDEGHGLNPLAVGALRAQGISLLITVDCGSSSVEEVELAASLGMDTIITDHHSLPGTLPRARAVVNPHRPDSRYPYESLTGAGIAFKLVQALWDSLGRPPPDHLLDLAALGTVADVAPLTGENRYLVSRGLENINWTDGAGLRALISRADLKPGTLDSESLSFGLIPRLNAAGRLGHASLSLDLLIADSVESAAPLAERLELQNDRRRRLTEEGVAQAMEQVAHPSDGVATIIIVEHGDWLPGILGLIASALSETYYRPAVAISLGEQVSRASVRSIPEFDVVAALRRCRSRFHRYGGHPRAAGFTLSTSDLPAVKIDLLAAAEEGLDASELRPSIDIDYEISPSMLDDQKFGFLQAMQPFGEGNPKPVFLTRNARVTEARRVGQRRDHLKLSILDGGRPWDAIAFRLGDRPVAPGDRVDLAYNIGLNHWGGRTTLQLNVLDIRKTG